ncbi:unnamed protein product, partial [Cyprideis torosa]
MPQSYPELNIAEPVKGFLETIEEVASVSSTNTEESSGAIAEERIIYLPDITDVEPIPEALQETEEEDHDTLPPPPNEMLEELSSLNESVVEEGKTMTLTSYDSTSTYPSSSTVNAGTTSDLQSTDSSCPVGDKTLSILEGARASLEILDSHSCVSEEPLTVMSSVMPIPESTETDESLSCRHVVVAQIETRSTEHEGAEQSTPTCDRLDEEYVPMKDEDIPIIPSPSPQPVLTAPLSIVPPPPPRESAEPSPSPSPRGTTEEFRFIDESSSEEVCTPVREKPKVEASIHLKSLHQE